MKSLTDAPEVTFHVYMLAFLLGHIKGLGSRTFATLLEAVYHLKSNAYIFGAALSL